MLEVFLVYNKEILTYCPLYCSCSLICWAKIPFSIY